MTACVRCGTWHTDAEEAVEKRLSCTEVKQYWAKIKREHHDLFGHAPQIVTDESGKRICRKCKNTVP